MRSLNVKNVIDLKPCVLLVDDEIFNLEILEELLDDSGYQTECAGNGRVACELLGANPEKYQAVLLDRMMPEMGGLEVTEFMKRDPQLSKIPVIMQSAKAAKQDIQDGLNAGILYYLTKPFAKHELLSIVDTAVRFFFDCQEFHDQLENSRTNQQPPQRIELRTVAEARTHAVELAHLADHPSKVVMGLYELIVNAIEHGNLGITYQEKSELLACGGWEAEVDRRQALAENCDKFVEVEFERDDGEIRITIADQGAGFDWQRYLTVSPERVFDSHGRGIAMANLMSFQRLEYVDPGNRVIATVELPASGPRP